MAQAGLAALLAPAAASAQSPPALGKGALAGGSVGVYFESAEGDPGHALAGSATFGRVTAGW